jgi:hypothetical protein
MLYSKKLNAQKRYNKVLNNRIIYLNTLECKLKMQYINEDRNNLVKNMNLL